MEIFDHNSKKHCIVGTQQIGKTQYVLIAPLSKNGKQDMRFNPISVTVDYLAAIYKEKNKQLPASIKALQQVEDKEHPFDAIKKRPYFKEALEDALYYSQNGEYTENNYTGDDDCEWIVSIGNVVLVDSLKDAHEAKILSIVLNNHLYDTVYIDVLHEKVAKPNIVHIEGYVYNMLFNDHVEESCRKYFNMLDEETYPFDTLYKIVAAEYTQAFIQYAALVPNTKSTYRYMSLEKLIDDLNNLDENDRIQYDN